MDYEFFPSTATWVVISPFTVCHLVSVLRQALCLYHLSIYLKDCRLSYPVFFVCSLGHSSFKLKNDFPDVMKGKAAEGKVFVTFQVDNRCRMACVSWTLWLWFFGIIIKRDVSCVCTTERSRIVSTVNDIGCRFPLAGLFRNCRLDCCPTKLGVVRSCSLHLGEERFHFSLPI